MNVSSTALPLNCDRVTSRPVESGRVKSGAGAGGSSVAGAASFARLAEAAVEVDDFDEPPQAASATHTTATAEAPGAWRSPRCRQRREALRTFGTLASARWRGAGYSLAGGGGSSPARAPV